MGWTAQYFTSIIIEGNTPSAGLFIYNGAPGPGTLVGSWTSAAGTDQYGNSYPAGINVKQGTISGVTETNNNISASTILNSTLQACSMLSNTFTAGTVRESTIIFDSNGGLLLNYASSTTTVTIPAGTALWTAPAGSYSTGYVRCIGPGSGGGGGGPLTGGEASGGGEYAAEPNYPLTPGLQYAVQVPYGTPGGTTGNAASQAQPCIFDLTQSTGASVYANPGQAGVNFMGGLGGSGSPNTISHAGGTGGSNTTQGNGGGASGGNSGNPTTGGTGGSGPSGNTGAPRPAAQTGSGQGGAGGNSGQNGGQGQTPGAGGGGAGNASSPGAVTKTYYNTHSYAYYGSQVGNGIRNTDGSAYQGAASGYLNSTGDQYSFYLMPYSQMQSDLSGATINSVKIYITNQHSWYGTGCYVVLGYAPFSSFGSVGNVSGATQNATNFFIGQGAGGWFDISGYGFGSAFQSGAARSIMIGTSASTGGGAGNLWNYGYFAGGPSSIAIQINYTPSGSSSVQAGQGGNAQIQVTYSTSTTLQSALSPLAGTDASGNAFAAGYTGPVQAFHPGSSPTTVEGWQTTNNPGGWSGYIRYKLLAEINAVQIDGVLTHSATTAKGNITLITLPAIYRPAFAVTLPIGQTNNTALAAPSPSCYIGTGGGITIYNVDVGTTAVDVHGTYFLN